MILLAALVVRGDNECISFGRFMIEVGVISLLFSLNFLLYDWCRFPRENDVTVLMLLRLRIRAGGDNVADESCLCRCFSIFPWPWFLLVLEPKDTVIK